MDLVSRLTATDEVASALQQPGKDVSFAMLTDYKYIPIDDVNHGKKDIGSNVNATGEAGTFAISMAVESSSKILPRIATLLKLTGAPFS